MIEVMRCRLRLPGTKRTVIGVAVAACVACLTFASTAAASRPVVISVRVTPRVLPSSGGEVAISVRVAHARTCTLYYEGLGAPRTFNCASGRIIYDRHVRANRTTGPEVWTTYAVAYNGRTHTRSRQVEIQVEASPSATPAVAGLDECAPGPECFYGPIDDTFPTYGNTTTLGDCTFAAAADWEQIFINRQPEPEQIAYEFGAAGGTESGGLSQAAFLTYWVRYGIGGLKARGFARFTPTPENVRNGVNDYSAMLVEFDFVQGTYFGNEQVSAGEHEAVVDGYTPEGPLVVTWGRTIQMTWEQWAGEVVGMWGVAL